MGKLIIHNENISDKEKFISVCPFGALELSGGAVTVNAACKMCRLCVKNSKNNEAEFADEIAPAIDKNAWSGIMVYVDHIEGKIHPVTYELIGKARSLAQKVGYKVYCLFLGSGISESADELLTYGVDEVFVYDEAELADFRIEPYTAAFEDCVNKVHPSVILVGATTVGRQLAPRVAARFRTGLTADCTVLDIEPNTDLVQIRPAFGGNIMAQISTPNNRPQMATVRYKVMESAKKTDSICGVVTKMSIDRQKLQSKIRIISVEKKPEIKTIDAADAIVVAGRGVRNKQDLDMLRSLCDCLGAQLACTRPLVEAGWMEANRQIGLSGRTVRPSLIITCGVSGAVQFTAGMNASDRIFAVNNDPNAPIFKTAHYGIVGDIYEVIPQLTKILQQQCVRR